MIFTPRGLKIRLEPAYAFGLMSRVEDEVPPFLILKTTEGVLQVPFVLASTAALVCAALGSDSPITIALATFVAYTLGHAAFVLGGRIFHFGLATTIGTAISFIPIPGLATGAIAAGVGVLAKDWLAAAAFVGSWLVASATAMFLFGWITVLVGRRALRRSNPTKNEPPATCVDAERAFFSAFTHFALKVNADTSLTITARERITGRETLARFDAEWPMITERFYDEIAEPEQSELAATPD